MSFLVVAFVGLIIIFATTTGLEGKFSQLLNPFERLTRPGVMSVQEHQPTAWGSFYFDYGIGIFFGMAGLYFAARNPTNRNVFMILFGLTSLYFASSMVRLLIVLAPAFSILVAMGLSGIMKAFVTVMKDVPKPAFRKKYIFGHVGNEFSAIAFILIMLLLIVTFIVPSRESGLPRVIEQAYTPVTLMSSSVPLRAPDKPVLDWYDTLMWMKARLPNDAVVASWWDYGYWITIIGNKTTLVDNGTFDLPQIQKVGTMFMSTIPDALEILKSRNVTHVVVFITFDSQGNDAGYGDEGKWRWMAKIPGLDDNSFGNYTLGKDAVYDLSTQQYTYPDNLKGQNTTLYKLMTYAKNVKLGQTSTVQLTDESGKGFEPAYFSQGGPYGGMYIVVAVYKVIY